jgi:hypothetical protein
MMSKLLSNTEEASYALTKHIRDFKISNFQGENVDKATSLLGGAVKRLTQKKSSSKHGPHYAAKHANNISSEVT